MRICTICTGYRPVNFAGMRTAGMHLLDQWAIFDAGTTHTVSCSALPRIAIYALHAPDHSVNATVCSIDYCPGLDLPKGTAVKPLN
eukprot:4000946-Heterocapsa_arctica.AAC.1